MYIKVILRQDLGTLNEDIIYYDVRNDITSLKCNVKLKLRTAKDGINLKQNQILQNHVLADFMLQLDEYNR